MVVREEHQTIIGADKNRIFLVLSFVLLYKNVRDIIAVKSKEFNFKNFIEIPFHGHSERVEEGEETPDDIIPESFKECLNQTLSKIRKPFQEGEDFCQNLAEMIRDPLFVE